jgi:hypothetical protein
MAPSVKNILSLEDSKILGYLADNPYFLPKIPKKGSADIPARLADSIKLRYLKGVSLRVI